MHRIPESELIINDRGAVYHLNVLPGELAHHIITVGDPSRVQLVSSHFDKIEVKSSHREFITHTGFIGAKRISVVSTGIGTDNIDIVLNELDALVNIDLDNRTIKKELQTLQLIRLGTAGSLQPDIPVDSFVVSTHGLGIDNLLNFYQHRENDEEKELLQAFVTLTQLHNRFSHPYITSAGSSLIKHFVKYFHQGITVTCPGFYGPQGRVLRLGLADPGLIDKLTGFRFGRHQIANFEMETAGIYGLGKLLGHQCLSISAIVANRITRQFSKDGNAAMEKLIEKTLETVSGL